MEVSVANQAVRWLNPLHGVLIWVCRGGGDNKKVLMNANIMYVCPTQRPKKLPILPDNYTSLCYQTVYHCQNYVS
jgi:hypothetical protein